MKKAPFPFSYFVNTITPSRVFYGRKALSKIQILVVFIFLTGIMLIPVTINTARSTTFQLPEIMPKMFQQLDTETLAAFKKVDFNEGRLKTESSGWVNQKETVGFLLTDAEFETLKSGINFGETSMELKDQSGYNFEVQYTKDFNPSQFTTVTELKQGISGQWLIQNRAFVAFTFIAMSGSLILVSHVILVFGGAFFVWLTRKNHFSSINSYQESLNLILNGLGLSSFFGMVFGLIQFDMSLVLSIQSFGLVLMLLGVFVTTRFNDEYRGYKIKKIQKV